MTGFDRQSEMETWGAKLFENCGASHTGPRVAVVSQNVPVCFVVVVVDPPAVFSQSRSDQKSSNRCRFHVF